MKKLWFVKKTFVEFLEEFDKKGRKESCYDHRQLTDTFIAIKDAELTNALFHSSKNTAGKLKPLDCKLSQIWKRNTILALKPSILLKDL